MYGTALMGELARHGYRVGPGTLYPILHALERAWYLRRENQVVAGRLRKYYRTNPAGRRILVRAQAQLGELVEEVLPMDGSKAPMKRPGSRSKTRYEAGFRYPRGDRNSSAKGGGDLA